MVRRKPGCIAPDYMYKNVTRQLVEDFFDPRRDSYEQVKFSYDTAARLNDARDIAGFLSKTPSFPPIRRP